MRIEAASWSRSTTNSLAVTRDVLGRSHQFEFEGRQVEVHLPCEEHAYRGKEFDETVSCVSWIHKNGERIPEGFAIYKVDLTIYLEKPVQVRKKMLEISPTRRNLTTQKKGQSI